MASLCGCFKGRKGDAEKPKHKQSLRTDGTEKDGGEDVNGTGKNKKKGFMKNIASQKPKRRGSKSSIGSANSSVKSILSGIMPRKKSWVDKLRPELKEKIQEWIISFYHLDPRYQILKFFNLVAKEGADNLLDDMSDNDNTSDKQFHESQELDDSEEEGFIVPAHIPSIIKDAFNTTSILTVWRPTSNEAMRKMMVGDGTGKGLNIKGKSAKKGKLSGFVPFMQIHTEEDKKHVSEISNKALVRIYFKSDEFRQIAISKLNEEENEDGEESGEEKEESGNEFKLIDDYIEKNMYGLELKQVKFWKVYVLDQDITRGEDTETGRPSTAGFQDGNLKTLKQACATYPPPDPFPVLLQLHEEDPMSPQYLVMAYEENYNVKPVVSDFDGFLMGWRREALWFGCNLPRDQEDLMMWCLDQIHDILKQPGSDSWTIRWLDILKEEAMKGNPNIPEVPQYGFGDPKSYSIMEKAAQKLLESGAVRHGSECFNYQFPQEIDDYFLLISDTLHPVPWKYVTTPELQEILIQKVKEGFVFPLNPKWILCDPGWKRVYDALMSSSALYADMSLDVWFPRYSGVRKKIDSLYLEYPNGFQRQEKVVINEPVNRKNSFRSSLHQSSLSGQAAGELAELELENFVSLQAVEEDDGERSEDDGSDDS